MNYVSEAYFLVISLGALSQHGKQKFHFDILENWR